jgi:ABC-type nickel/cobalt efflux system permease component RcnA
VFCLGVATLAASRFVAPEIIIPVLSVGSGLTVIGLGLWLFKKRWDKLWSARRTHLKKDLKPDPAKQSAAHHHHHHHDPPAPGKVTFGGLLALGVSGGIVPCPAALVLLLGAIAAGRAAFGLGLLAAFSLGLSAVLIAVGLAVLYAKELVPAHVARDESWTHYVPVFSALVITFSGLFLTAWAIRSLL